MKFLLEEDRNPDGEPEGNGHIGTGHMDLDIAKRGECTRKRHIGYRDIGNPVDTGFMQFDIAISGTSIRDKAVALWYNGHMDQELIPKG